MGRDASVSRSHSTSRGWWNAPTRFLPALRFTPTLPPTELSTCASSVVGTCTNGDAAQIGGGDKAGQIAHHAAAEGDDE